MPTYEYGCAACGHEWEQSQRITEPPIEVCPKCAKAAAHRLISAGTNFILKGGGWYSDLYSSAKSPSKKVDEKGASTPDASKPDKAEAKPATDAPKTTPSTPSTPSSPPPTASST